MRTNRRVWAAGVVLLAVLCIYLLNEKGPVQQQRASPAAEELAAKPASQISPRTRSSGEIIRPITGPIATETAESAFKEFIEKMEGHSALLHEEFKALEQLSALHPNEVDEGENTNQLVFAKMRVAFEELGRRAATNEEAFRLLVDATQSRYLSGVAVAGIGVAAENGKEKAIEMLLEPEANGWLLSSCAGALVNVARAGHDQAIGFMYQLTTDPAKKALWGFATQALVPAAEAGNEQAIAGLVNMSGSPGVLGGTP
jgi:hypothetical protein